MILYGTNDETLSSYQDIKADACEKYETETNDVDISSSKNVTESSSGNSEKNIGISVSSVVLIVISIIVFIVSVFLSIWFRKQIRARCCKSHARVPTDDI